MLWLMSRVAWEKQKLGHADEPEPLTTHHVNNIIHNELKLGADADVFARIRLGLLLAMQAELKAGMHRILWGHQSFFEFLVARYWALKLRRIIGTPPYHPERKEIEKSLFGAPVLGGDNRIFRFLKEILNSDPWTDNDRTGLHDWAKECFEDDEQYFGDDPVTIRNDRRVPLRMTALAIGCSLSDHEPLEDQSGEHLRSLIAWHFQRGEHCQLFAPGLKATDVYLRGANLNGANLSDAHLRGANLSNANLHGAILIDAHLRGAILIDANLSGAILINANLHGAILIDANLSDARLSNANLSDARLRDARYNNNTQFPDGFGNPEERGMIKVE
ncbi:MAG: pentapeptide repeat-containing protein [Proteobacteria bacterium]|nr:pentapeptide repeat-containing protein [Pseudomonadota bacterium]